MSLYHSKRGLIIAPASTEKFWIDELLVAETNGGLHLRGGR